MIKNGIAIAMNHSEKQLIEAYLKGDYESLEILVRQYLRPIYGFVYKQVGNAQDSEDITQDVFVKVWKNIKKFDRKKSFKSWIFSIAKNSVIDFIRKSHLASGEKKSIPFSSFENEEGDSILDSMLLDTGLLPDEIYEQKETKGILLKTMERLSVKYQAVLSLYYEREFNFREIAKMLGEPINTVKSRHRRGLMALRKNLADFSG